MVYVRKPTLLSMDIVMNSDLVLVPNQETLTGCRIDSDWLV